MTSFKTGDKVLWTENLTTTFKIVEIKELATGRIVVAEFAQVPEGAASFKLEAPEHKFVTRPDGWQDAPERPACRCGRFDGAEQDEAARSAWFTEMRRWDAQFKQPLIAKLRDEATNNAATDTHDEPVAQPQIEEEESTDDDEDQSGAPICEPTDTAIADAIAGTLSLDRLEELRAALECHHNEPYCVIVLSKGGWCISLGLNAAKFTARGKTLSEAVKKVVTPKDAPNPMQARAELLAKLRHDPDAMSLVLRAFGLDVKAAA